MRTSGFFLLILNAFMLSLYCAKRFKMYEIVFYEDKTGYSELFEELRKMADAASTNKDVRIQLKQITFYVELLKQQGTRLPNNITKHIEDDVWELRPGNNRILYFYFKDNRFVLLHMFRKQTQKTPKSEIKRAKREVDDYRSRNGGK